MDPLSLHLGVCSLQLLFIKATQEWRGKSTSCSPALNLKRWTRGPISYYESPMLFSSTDYSIIAFLVEHRSTFGYCAWWKFSWFSGIHYNLDPLQKHRKAWNNRKSLPTVTLDLSSNVEYYGKTFERWNISSKLAKYAKQHFIMFNWLSGISLYCSQSLT